MPAPIQMPKLSPTMKMGKIIKWIKKEGDKVSPGDIIMEVETDKSVLEFETSDSGIMGPIIAPEGSDVQVNELVGVILEKGEDKNVLSDFLAQFSNSTPSQSTDTDNKIISNTEKTDSTNPSELTGSDSQNKEKSQNLPTQSSSNKIFASPLAKRLAGEKNINLQLLTPGSGPHGRIIKDDVMKFNNESIGKKPDISIANYGRNPNHFEKLPISGMRKVIAKRLLESKQNIPHFYLNASCKIDKLLTLRKEINDLAPIKDEKPVYKISVNDIVIKAVAKAMLENPDINTSWGDDFITQYNNIDISVAVSTDGGLITPIIQNADQKSIIVISNEMKELAIRARANKLKPEEFQGGSFSISNLGMYNIEKFNAIINPPQSAILAVGAAIEKPIVTNKQIEIATIAEFTLSCDHRVIDGAVAAKFLNSLKKFIENPILMLV